MKAIYAGLFHSMALKEDGTVVAWGRNSEGQTPVPADLSGVTAISAGGSHNLALNANGTVVAWGYNGYGESTVPPGLSSVTAIAAGGYHSMAIGEEDLVSPKVTSVAPAENATDIGPRTNVRALFSEAMKAGSVNTKTVKLFKAGTTTPLAAVVSYDPERKKAILNPNANLQLGKKYKAVVTTATKDLAGNRLDQNTALSGLKQKAWFFTVRN